MRDHERAHGHGHARSDDGRHDGHTSHHAHMVADFRRRFWISLALSVPVLALAPMLQRAVGLERVLAFAGDAYVQLLFASVIFFYGGWPFLTGMVAELRRRRPGMMTLIALAVSVAYGYSALVVLGLRGDVFFWELATLIDIMLAGHWIEMRSVMGASNALQKLVRLMPSVAHRLEPDGSIVEIPIGEVVKGDRLLVKPGEKIPTDGTITEGATSVNQAMLTGESRPVSMVAGDEVIGGSINGEAAFTLEVSRTGADTYLAQVIELVRQAQESRSRSQDLANRAAQWLTAVALSVGGLTLTVWLALDAPFDYALERMVTVMVITCPHALGLAAPPVRSSRRCMTAPFAWTSSLRT